MLRFFTASLFLLTVLRPALAQTPPPARAYMYLIYHKLNPGKTIQDALPVEKSWQKINQAAVDEGKLLGWYMTVKQNSSNPNAAEYDYVTRIVSPGMNMGGASPEAMRRIYGDSVQAKMTDLQQRDRATAPVIKVENWVMTSMASAPSFAPNGEGYLVVERLKRRIPGADYDAAVGQMKQFSEARIKRGNLLGWDFSELLVPNGSEKGYEFSTSHFVKNLSDLVDPNLSGSASPVMPIAAYKQYRQRTEQTFDVVRQEVYRIMEFTSPAKN